MFENVLKKLAGFKDSRTAAILISVVFVVVVFIASFFFHSAQKTYLDRAIDVSAQNIENTLAKKTYDILDSIGRMGDRWNNHDGTDELLWRADAHQYVTDIDGVDVLMWVDSTGVLQWAESRESVVTPEKGFNFFNHGQLKEKMLLSRESKLPEFSKITKLPGNNYAIHVFHPIWNKHNFDGFIGARLDIDVLLSSMVQPSGSSGFVLEAKAKEIQVFLAQGSHDTDGPQKTFHMNMDADNEGWDFTVYPTSEVLSLFQSPLPVIMAFSGFLIGILFFLTMNSRIKAKANARLLAKEMKRSQQMESQIRHMSQHDALTHLPNRSYLNIYLENKIKECEASGQKIAVLYLNIDDFKLLNDVYTHQLADEVLKIIPKRINEVLKRNSMIAHMGGDEFVICLSENLIEEKMFIYAEDLLKNIRKPINVDAESIRITASIGVCYFPHQGYMVGELLTKAEHAMNQAKQLGKDVYTIFDENLESSSLYKAELIQAFNKGIDNNEFEMFFQPRYNIKSGEMVGAEALLRWNKDGKIMSPDSFLDVAEDSGMIINICNTAFNKAFAQYQQLFNGNPPIMLAINVSAKQLAHPDFLNDLFAMMEAHHFPSEMLEVELTEQTLIQNFESSLATLNALSSADVKIALDDFGTGYSSLSYLKNFPVNVLKIDKSFVKDIHQDESDLELAKAIIAMGKSLKMEVVAEGVENQNQLQILSDEGCQQAQGFYLNKPLPFAAFDKLFNNPKSSTDKLQ